MRCFLLPLVGSSHSFPRSTAPGSPTKCAADTAITLHTSCALLSGSSRQPL